MSVESRSNFTHILPLELIIEILSYVESESLLLFRRVSRSCKFFVDNFHKFESFVCDEKSNKPWISWKSSIFTTSADYYHNIKSLFSPSMSKEFSHSEPDDCPCPCFYDLISTLHVGNLKENCTIELKPIRDNIRRLHFYGRISFDNLDRILSQCEQVESLNFTGESLCGSSPSLGFFSRRTLRFLPFTNSFSSVLDDSTHEFQKLRKIRIILNENTRGVDGRVQNQNPYNVQTFSSILKKFEGQQGLKTFILRSNAGTQNVHLLQMLATHWHHILEIVTQNVETLDKLVLTGISIPPFDLNNVNNDNENDNNGNHRMVRRDWTDTFCELDLQHFEVHAVRGHLSTRIHFLRFVQSQSRLRVFSVLSHELNFSLFALQELLLRNPHLISLVTPVTPANLTNAIKLLEDSGKPIFYQLHHTPRL